ncbi:smad nuclear interacting protein [Dactylonectria estremocensis]|uniref:Smad nuclear interacting protein n=1 Tax=Dactylonectria estremocensis TaxID=1079267 RepID=A0A9P9F5J6_9HYPO|nr:smad nuclear interacting protein [Dactylonectria estremocensis]
MPSDEERDSGARRPRPNDEQRGEREDRDERSKQSDRGSHRRRSRERRDQHKRRRSRTPETERRRSRSRDRDRRRDRDRHRDRDQDRDQDRDRDHRRQRSREGRDSRRRRHDKDVEETDDKQLVKRDPLKRNGPLPSQQDSFAITNGEEPEKPKEKPNFGNSGVLAAASNSVSQADGSTITLKYHEPAEARKPSPRDQWKLYVFKGGDVADTVDLSARSCWLIGREAAVVDLPAEHPSISKQHAVIQFRYTEKRNEFGDKIGKVKPYLIDLESANGTVLNDDKVPDSRYLELRDKDMIQFGHSTREYVLMLAPRT